MKSLFKKRPKGLLTALLFLLLFLFPPIFRVSALPTSAESYSGDLIRIESYDADFTVRKDRKIEVTERISVKFLTSGTTMFYRSFPTEGCLYENITAKCEGNSDFYYTVESGETSGFFDVNCIGGVHKGAEWTYEISYVMQDGTNKVRDGMIVDVIGFGWQIPLHNVTLRIAFPEPLTEENYDLWIGAYGVGKEDARKADNETLSADGKTLTLQEDLLEVTYNSFYDERSAEGITLEFSYGGGVLESYTKTRLLTDDMGMLLLFGVLFVGGAVALLFLTRKKREMITVVNVKAPDDMDPLKMGVYLDGSADNEDVTSMIYYFAYKGYLKIDFSDEKDPKLITSLDKLPEDAPVHQKTLFKGLFRGAKVVSDDPFDMGEREIKISELTGTFFETVEVVKKQVPSPKPMYEKKSVFGYIGGGILAILFAILAPLFMSRKVGGGYMNPFVGIMLVLSVVLSLVLGFVQENYRYKWKKGTKFTVTLVKYGVLFLISLLFIFNVAEFFMTEYEKLVVCVVTFACCMLTQNALSRTEKYVRSLGDILGFKEFILVTEEDKIKFMLEENPELYYKVLPYAQVLGVTDVWEKKFANITLAPPTWYVGDFTLFDYMILNNCMRSAMLRSMAAAAQKSGGGRFVGGSGGGGSFGGFGGGGFGGGGGGAR